MKRLAFIFLITTACLRAEAQQELWGTASLGGEFNGGFIYKSDSIGDNLEIVHHFKKDIDGENISALLLGSNHKLYGLASSGGQGGSANVFQSGTFFEYDLTTNQFRVIEHFGPLSTKLPGVFMPNGDGKHSLTEVSPGLIYGIAMQGSYVFSYNLNTGVFGNPIVVPNYNGGATNSSLRNRIAEGFYKAADGNLYAATFTNSSCPIPNPNMGSIFRVVPATNTLTIPYKASCIAENGYTYNGYFAEVSGKLYGTTNGGGTANQGVIYEYTPSSNVYVKRHDFQGGVASNSFYPTSLVLANNGKLYGTTWGGGVPEQNLPGGGGILYEFDLQTNTFTKKYDFLMGVGWLGDVGAFPSSLVKGVNGKLYGGTQFGVFEYNTTTNELRMAGRFWNLGFTPSLLQLCRKPTYQNQSSTTREVCAGETFTLDLASPNANTVTWSHNTTNVPSQTTSKLIIDLFSATDAGTWICTMTNECGTTTSQTFTLELNSPFQPSITADGTVEFCAGENVTLKAPDGFNAYTWSTGATSQEIVVNEGGEYSVSVNNGCESPQSELVTVTVHELPLSPTGIESPSYNKLKAIGNSPAYVWTHDGAELSEQTSEIEITESGLYQVWGKNNEGCLSADFASLAFIVTSLENDITRHISIYPNPTNNVAYVNVSGELLGPVEVMLFNAKGQLVITQSAYFNREGNVIPLEDLPSGLYHLQLRNASLTTWANVIIR
ncbi:MAG: choice-of-anchor tandem repeat GloVer-containing protein [Chryseolinea sp.]